MNREIDSRIRRIIREAEYYERSKEKMKELINELERNGIKRIAYTPSGALILNPNYKLKEMWRIIKRHGTVVGLGGRIEENRDIYDRVIEVLPFKDFALIGDDFGIAFSTTKTNNFGRKKIWVIMGILRYGKFKELKQKEREEK